MIASPVFAQHVFPFAASRTVPAAPPLPVIVAALVIEAAVLAGARCWHRWLDGRWTVEDTFSMTRAFVRPCLARAAFDPVRPFDRERPVRRRLLAARALSWFPRVASRLP